MTISSALRCKEIDSTDAELLLAHVLNVHRTAIFLDPQIELTIEQEFMFKNYVERRRNGEPVAYILGEKEFYSRPFFVNPGVLIPRPATEGLIEVTLETLLNRKSIERGVDAGIVAISHYMRNPEVLVDIGTGSGCIAVTLAMEQSLPLIAVDSSEEALIVAQNNADRWGVAIDFRQGRYLEPIKEIKRTFFVVSNPPYVSENAALMKDVSSFEPHAALFSGSDGLDMLKELIRQCRENAYCVGMALECRTEQSDFVKHALHASR